jgi:two-component system, NtrC family, response regulator
MASVLVIDDQESICALLSLGIKREGHQVVCVQTLEEGLRQAREGAFDVVLLDVNFPEGSGLDVLPQIKGAPSSPEVIILTGASDPDGAELAVKSGAWDYLQKRSSLQALNLSLRRALEHRASKARTGSPVALETRAILGSSSAIKTCFDFIALASSTDASVLVTGESGTGKELVARAIHQNSPRAQGNFVVVDCAALPPALVGSLLFGHLKGAFTGADQAQEGLVTHADGGTLFLDEVGDLPLSEQRSFLRVLQEKCFYPVGGTREVHSDFRLICATNRDLDAMVQQGRFREDLLFRLRTLAKTLPPLRERHGDVQEIAFHHVAQLCEADGVMQKGFAPEFLLAITAYTWPGNVRELLHALEGALSAARHAPILLPHHLPTNIRAKLARVTASETDPAPPWSIGSPTAPPSEACQTWQAFRKKAVEAAEKTYLQSLISQSGGQIETATDISGLSQPRLYALLRKHGLSLRAQSGDALRES